MAIWKKKYEKKVWILLHTDAFTDRGFYTQRLLHTDPFTHKDVHTHKHLHTDTFHTDLAIHIPFSYNYLLVTLTESFTHRRSYT